VVFVLFLYPNSLDPFVNQPDAIRPSSFSDLLQLSSFLFFSFQSGSIFRLLAQVLRFIPEKRREKAEKILDKFYTGFAVQNYATSLV